MRRLIVVIEPTLVGGLRITFTWMPIPTVDVTICAMSHAPVGFSSPSCFVTDPASFTTYTPKHTVRLYLVHGVAKVGHIVVDACIAHVHCATTTAVIAITAIGTVKPHFKLVVTILCQLSTLAQEHLRHITICTVVHRVSVPWRDIETIFQS